MILDTGFWMLDGIRNSVGVQGFTGSGVPRLKTGSSTSIKYPETMLQETTRNEQ